MQVTGTSGACEYTVTETAQTGYSLNTTASSTLTGVTLTPGGTTNLTVQNDQDPGSIQVTKSVVGADAPNGWEFTLSTTTAGCSIPGTVTNPATTADGSGGVVTFSGLQVATSPSTSCEYTVTETAQTGWTLNTTASSTLTGVTITAGNTTNLTVQNDQDLGGIAVTKTVNGAAAPAAWQFTLTSTTAGCVIPGTVTNPASTADGSGGSVSFTGLPLRSSTTGAVCEYTVSETAQTGYTLNVTASSTLTGIVPATPNTAISVVNDEDPGAIEVTKSVVGADAPNGWEFTLSVSGAGCAIPGSVTNPQTTADGSGGVVTFSGLQVSGTSGACQYTVAETAQTGWTLNTTASSTLTGVTVTSGNTTNLTVQNDQDLGGIAVTKTVNGAAAPAAWQFTLTSTTAGCVIPGTVTNPASTADGSGGSVSFTGLPLRSSTDGSVCQYTVSETAQTGYTLNTTASSTLTGIVPATPNTAISVVNDEDPGAIQVTKSVVGADAPNGWEFTLSVSGAGCAIPGAVTNPQTTADGSGGVVTFSGLQVAGTSGACQYTVAETAQTGWTLNTTASSTLTGVTVTAGSTTNLTVQNDQDLGGIAVTKTVNGAAAPAAWQFTLTSTTAGCVIPGTVTNPASTADGSGGSVNFTGLPLRSSTDGSVCEYNVAETAQTGYTLNVTASSALTGIVPATPNTAISVVNDEDPGAIQVTKSVVGADAPAAWEFTLSTTSAGCSIPGTVTNPASTADGSGGVVTFTGLQVTGTSGACEYTVTETAQTGYSLNTTASSTLTGVTLSPGGTTNLTVQNDQDPGSIQVTKSVVGADAPNGWEFTLSTTTAGCSIPGTVTNPASTADGSGGVVTFSGLQVATSPSTSCEYTVTETAQTGWTLNTTASSTLTGVTITAGNTTNLTVQNDQDLGGIAVTKTVNGADAPAAWQFTLTSTTAGCVIPGTVTNPASTADGSGGSVSFTGLPLRSSVDGSACEYSVAETAQTGYTLNTTASSTLTGIVPATPNTAISVVNDEDPGSIQVTKSVVGADAPNGWEFTLSTSTAGCSIPGTVTNPATTADGSGGVVTFSGLQVTGTSGACEYTVAETAQTGWTLNTTASSTLTGVTVTSGNTTNLTVQNDQDLGGIAVTKTVNGAAAPAAWQFTLTSTTAGCVIPGTVTNLRVPRMVRVVR